MLPGRTVRIAGSGSVKRSLFALLRLWYRSENFLNNPSRGMLGCWVVLPVWMCPGFSQHFLPAQRQFRGGSPDGRRRDFV